MLLLQLESANRTTHGVLEQLTTAQGQVQYLQERMEQTTSMTRTIDDPQGPATLPEPNQMAAQYPNVVMSNVQLPLVSAATLTDFHGLDAPVNPGLTGKRLKLATATDSYHASMTVASAPGNMHAICVTINHAM